MTIYKVTLLILVMSLISGCSGRGTICKAPDKDPMKIEVFYVGGKQKVVKDRFDLSAETTYIHDIKVTSNKITAYASPLLQLTWRMLADNEIELNKDNNTVTLGETTYTCDENFAEEFEKINHPL